MFFTVIFLLHTTIIDPCSPYYGIAYIWLHMEDGAVLFSSAVNNKKIM
jgi:hypothetical protein